MKHQTVTVCSSAPLVRKLGIKQGCRVLLINEPREYRASLGLLPEGVVFAEKLDAAVDLAHVFVTEREDLAGHLAVLRETLRPDAAVWVSWPKKTARVPTTITDHVVRELAFPLDYVDIKICAVSEVWSGLKLVVRKALR